jgi:ribosomal protein S18 acetylase RimI-like enzyme
MPEFRPGLGDDTERYIRLDHGYIEFRYAPGNTCEIVNIEVENEHRGQGVGRKLLELLFDKVIKQSVITVYAITTYDNRIAQMFYERTRFKVSGVLREFYDPACRHADAILYARNPRGPV